MYRSLPFDALLVAVILATEKNPPYRRSLFTALHGRRQCRAMAAAENPSDIIDTRYNIGIIDSRGTINVFHPAPFRHRRHPRYRGLRPSHVSMVHNAPTIPSDVTSGVIQG